MEEIWKDIDGFDNYEVSNTAKVRPKARLLAVKTNKSGNLEVSLNKGDKRHGKMLGRLVYEAFSGEKLSKNDVIIYLDGDKTNCNYDNLRVVSRSEREKMAYEKGEKKANRFEYYGEYLTISQIAEKTGVPQTILEQRVYRRGWNIYEAVEVPKNIYKKKGIDDGGAEF